MIYVNDIVYEDITITDATGVVQTGRTFTKVLARDPLGNDFTPTVTEISNGLYRVSFPVPLAGDWYIQYSVNTSPAQIWTITEDVDPVSASGVAGISPTSGTTLASLVSQVATLVRDRVLATASIASGANNTFTDTRALYEDDRYFRGAEAYVLSGTPANLGQVRRVQGSELNTSTITFVSGLPANPQIGDKIELVNIGSRGFRRDEYREAINFGIQSANPQNQIPVAATALTTYTSEGFVVIPDTIKRLSTVEYQDTTGIWHEIEYSGRSGPGFYINRTDLSIGLRGDWMGAANGMSLRFTGYAKAAPLVNDSDLTSTDSEYLVNWAAGYLIMSKRDTSIAQFGQAFLNRADALRAKMAAPTAANTIWIRD